MASRISSPRFGSTEAAEIAGTWAVSCFVVLRQQRRSGVSAETVEGYPVDPSAKKSVSGAELFHGALSVFLAAGFTEVHRPIPARVLVRKQL
jgi:hypothetical protein